MTQTADDQGVIFETFDKEQIVGYNNSIQMNEVDAMAKERDYKREWETEKARGVKLVGAKISEQLKDDFEAKCESNNTTKNAVLKSYIERYTYENFDQ